LISGGLVLIEREIIREIVTISRCIASIRNEEFNKQDLTRGQHSFLTRIMENPGITQEELSYMLRIDKTTTAKALKKLEEKGYIKKYKSKIDRRSWTLYPDDKLIDIYPYLVTMVENTARHGLDGFSESEMDVVKNFLERIRINIDLELSKLKK
jgi:DNA-binding MarR family transcriptional regulator